MFTVFVYTYVTGQLYYFIHVFLQKLD